MPGTIVVLVQEDPHQTHLAAEGLRIALGLSTGPNPLTIILLGSACSLLTDEAIEALDGEIIEKHLPVIQELEIPILVPDGTLSEFAVDPSFSVQEVSSQYISSFLMTADKVLIF